LFTTISADPYEASFAKRESGMEKNDVSNAFDDCAAIVMNPAG
jgi:hypothetical protein